MDAATESPTANFETLDQALRASGPGALVDRLVALAEGLGDPRALLDALLLKARHELGLPPIPLGGLAELPEPVRGQYEDRYVEAIRTVGRRLLDGGDLVAAWPYFRTIGEPEPIAAALDAYRPAEGDEALGSVVEVAFNQGAHPRRGFELILDHYGPCSALSAFEHLPPDESTRVACADRLVRHIHEQLVASLRADFSRRGQPQPRPGAAIPDLIAAGGAWLFAGDAYHLDVSHLAATVRLAPLLTDPATLALAVELTDYGRRLSERLQYEGDPPFERLYEDHARYLRALLGQEADSTVSYFVGKLAPPDPDNPASADTLPAQMLVRLLVRLDRLDEAVDLAAQHLAEAPESALICPGLAQLCRLAGRPDRLAALARDRGDLIGYAAALLQTAQGPGADDRP